MDRSVNETLMEQMAALTRQLRHRVFEGEMPHPEREGSEIPERMGHRGRPMVLEEEQNQQEPWCRRGFHGPHHEILHSLDQEAPSGPDQEPLHGPDHEPLHGLDHEPPHGPHHGPHHRGRDGRPPMARERVLRIIEEEEGISQRKIAESLFIRPQSLSELLGKLEKDEFIARKQNENDKREILVYLTEKGKERAKEVEESRARQAAGLFEALTEEEKVTLSSLLQKLLAQYEQE